MDNGEWRMENFLEQREQNGACTDYAESRQNRSKTMENFLEQRGQSDACLIDNGEWIMDNG